jgi:hypothetical protein
MPLYARRADDHFPDRRDRSPHVDHHVVLSGGLEVGGFHRIGSGPSEGRWSWGASLTSSSGFTAGGYSHSSDGCKELIGASFRKMLARADLRERSDALPGPPRRAPPEGTGTPSASRPHDRNADRQLGPTVRNERRVTVRSGELTVGALIRATHGDEAWLWFLTGLARPDDDDFVWQGHADSEHEALVALALCWSRWTYWAGLEPVAPLRRGMKRV